HQPTERVQPPESESDEDDVSQWALLHGGDPRFPRGPKGKRRSGGPDRAELARHGNGGADRGAREGRARWQDRRVRRTEVLEPAARALARRPPDQGRRPAVLRPGRRRDATL